MFQEAGVYNSRNKQSTLKEALYFNNIDYTLQIQIDESKSNSIKRLEIKTEILENIIT